MVKEKLLLEEITELYLKSKKDPFNPQLLTAYLFEYYQLRRFGLQHKTTMQKLYIDYTPKLTYKDIE